MIRAAVLVGIAILVYCNVFTHPFVHDDLVFVVQNPHIGQLRDLPQVFLGHSNSTPGSIVNTYYRPLLEVIYRVEYLAFGFNPVGWHIVNVLLHGFNGVLVFRLLMLLGFGGLVPWGTAILFLIHPIQTESVACVAGISNLVMAFFVLSSLIAYLKEKWALSLLMFVCGMLAKEQALVAVPLAMCCDHYLGRKRFWPWTLAVLAAIGCFAFRQMITGAHVLGDIAASPGELKLRLAAIAQTLVMYLQTILLPIDLHYYRSTDILSPNSGYWLAIAAFVIILAQAPKMVRFGAVWFLLSLFPVLNIVPLINEYSLILTAEHFLYLPLIGMGLVIVGVAQRYLTAEHLKIALIALAVVLSLVSIRQNLFWKSEIALFERTVAFEPEFGRGHLLLAKAYLAKGQYVLANDHLNKAYTIMDGYYKKAQGDGPKRFYQGFMNEIKSLQSHPLILSK